MKVVNDYIDFEIIDTSDGMKYERWGNIYLLRPDPLVIWNNGDLSLKYHNINSIYHRSNKGGGYWEDLKNVPENWSISYHDMKFNLKKMGFKHTGLFPEQAINWNYIREKIKESKRDNIKVLNLFAYTGGATIAAMMEGAFVTHVDSSRGMVSHAKENVKLNHLDETKVRFIIDDVIKFVKREIRRNNKYDAIIMDPPAFGRGANGEVWDIEKDLYELITLCNELLCDKPLFMLVNSYSGLSPTILYNVLKLTNKRKGNISIDEIGLPIKNNDLTLPCGIYGRIDYE